MMVDLLCPLPDCGSCLHVTWMLDSPLCAGDVAPPKPADAYTSNWTVGCEEGHVILTPGLVGCGCEDPSEGECHHNEDDYDWNEELRTFTIHDVRRLEAVLAALRITYEKKAQEGA